MSGRSSAAELAAAMYVPVNVTVESLATNRVLLGGVM